MCSLCVMKKRVFFAIITVLMCLCMSNSAVLAGEFDPFADDKGGDEIDPFASDDSGSSIDDDDDFSDLFYFSVILIWR